MARNETTSAIIDGMLKLIAVGGLVATIIVAPNAVQALDKPLSLYFRKLDKRAREREYRRYLQYMKRQGLIKYRSIDYEHGIELTVAGKKRAERANFEALNIPALKNWDKKWRIVFFDIPEKYKTSRDYLSRKLRAMGLVQLQRSVWVYPFPCLEEVEIVTRHYGVSNFISYIETEHINSQQKLKERFRFKF